MFFEALKNLFNNTTFIADIYIHSMILFTFLSLLFIFFIQKLSINGFNNEVDHGISLLNTRIDKIKDKPIVKQGLAFINLENIIKNTHVEDKYVKKNNDSIKSNLIIVNILLWFFITLLIIIINNTCSKHIDWKELAIQNFIIFSVIGAIEVIFLNLIIVKYIPVEPSYISNKFLEIIRDKFKTVD